MTAKRVLPVFSGRHPKFFDNFRSFPTSHGDCPSPLYPCRLKGHACLCAVLLFYTEILFIVSLRCSEFVLCIYASAFVSSVVSKSYGAICDIGKTSLFSELNSLHVVQPASCKD